MLLNRVGGSIITQGGGGNLEFPPEPYVGRLYYKPDGSRYDDIKKIIGENEFRFDLRRQTEFRYPTWIASDTQGNLYCTTSVNGVITKFSPDLEVISKITTSYPGLGHLAVDLDGNFYIAVTGAAPCIAKVMPNGSTIWKLPAEGNPRIYGLDKNNRTLYIYGRITGCEKIDLDGNVLYANYEKIQKDTVLTLEICENGDIFYVPYSLKDTIYVYNAENELVSSKKMPFTYISDIKRVAERIFVCSATVMAACNANWQVESQVSYNAAVSSYLKMVYMDKLNTFVLLGAMYTGFMIEVNQSESGKVSLQMLSDAREDFFAYVFATKYYLYDPIICLANNAVYIMQTVRAADTCGISRMPMNAKLMCL